MALLNPNFRTERRPHAESPKLLSTGREPLSTPWFPPAAAQNPPLLAWKRSKTILLMDFVESNCFFFLQLPEIKITGNSLWVRLARAAQRGPTDLIQTQEKLRPLLDGPSGSTDTTPPRWSSSTSLPGRGANAATGLKKHGALLALRFLSVQQFFQFKSFFKLKMYFKPLNKKKKKRKQKHSSE